MNKEGVLRTGILTNYDGSIVFGIHTEACNTDTSDDVMMKNHYATMEVVISTPEDKYRLTVGLRPPSSSCSDRFNEKHFNMDDTLCNADGGHQIVIRDVTKVTHKLNHLFKELAKLVSDNSAISGSGLFEKAFYDLIRCVDSQKE